MAEYGEWNHKGAVLSDKTAQKEYGLTRDLIVTGIQTGKLESREGAVWGNPYLRVLRSQLEQYITEQLGSEYLSSKKTTIELRVIARRFLISGSNWLNLRRERLNLNARSRRRAPFRPFRFVRPFEDCLRQAEKLRGGVAAPLTEYQENYSAAKKAKPPGRRPWSKEDVRDLKAHSKARTPVEKISKAMKRTVSGLRQKALALGIGLGHRR